MEVLWGLTMSWPAMVGRMEDGGTCRRPGPRRRGCLACVGMRLGGMGSPGRTRGRAVVAMVVVRRGVAINAPRGCCSWGVVGVGGVGCWKPGERQREVRGRGMSVIAVCYRLAQLWREKVRCLVVVLLKLRRSVATLTCTKNRQEADAAQKYLDGGAPSFAGMSDLAPWRSPQILPWFFFV